MDKDSFIDLLNRSSPNEIREFLIEKGKVKLIYPFIEYNDDEIRRIEAGELSWRDK